jgi:3-phenylpropionate/cinnamic acid dioxygenase small subunit
MSESVAEAAAMLAIGRRLLEDEGVFLDERRWEEWLDLYAHDCEYWVPAWTASGRLAQSPQAEVSHIFYSDRSALWDRIVRFTSGTSPASRPLPRTAHLLSAVHLLDHGADEMRLRSTWATHVYFPYRRESHTFFGPAEGTLIRHDGRWLIGRKKVVLLNEYIPTMLDIYCL